MLTITRDRPDLVEMQAAGILTKEDYEQIVPQFERILETARPLRVLIELTDFHGWNLGGFWAEIKFDSAHLKDLGRVAVVGENAWEKWGTEFSKLFVSAEVRYFDQRQKDAVRRWLMAESPEAS